MWFVGTSVAKLYVGTRWGVWWWEWGGRRVLSSPVLLLVRLLGSGLMLLLQPLSLLLLSEVRGLGWAGVMWEAWGGGKCLLKNQG